MFLWCRSERVRYAIATPCGTRLRHHHRLALRCAEFQRRLRANRRLARRCPLAAVERGSIDAQCLTSALHAHAGGQLRYRFHQAFPPDAGRLRGIPSKLETFFWTSMMVSACASFWRSCSTSRSSSATRWDCLSCGLALRPRLRGASAFRAPDSRWRRQVFRWDEYSPSRRSKAPIWPDSLQRSACSRMLNLQYRNFNKQPCNGCYGA